MDSGPHGLGDLPAPPHASCLRMDDTLASILGARARDLGCLLLVAGCADDHVHTVVRLAGAVPLADLVRYLKGAAPVT